MPSHDAPQRARPGALWRGILFGGAVVLAVVMTAASAVLAWLGVHEVESAEAPATTRAPITTPVEIGQLTTTVLATGHVVPGPSLTVPPPAAPEGRKPVVTSGEAGPGQGVEEGQLLVAVALRPQFVLRGEVPMFRPLTLGVDGPDVVQVQQSLARLGYDVGEADGDLGVRTMRALTALYDDWGYDVWTVDGTEATRRTPLASLVIPVGELAFVPTLPAHVLDCPTVGSPATQESCVLSVGNDRYVGRIPSSLAQHIEVGSSVSLAGASGEASLRVSTPAATPSGLDSPDTSIAGSPAAGPRRGDGTGPGAGQDEPAGAGGSAADAADPADAPGNTGVVEFGLESLQAESGEALWEGTGPIELTVITDASPADSLIVPTTAIRELAGGDVVDVARGGEAVTVPVTVGLCTGGRCVILPEQPGALSAGDEVRVYGGGASAG